MARPFALTDIFFLSREATRGTCFHTRVFYTEHISPVKRAMSARLFPSNVPETIIFTEGITPTGFGQLSHRPGSPLCRLRFLAPQEIYLSGDGAGLLEPLLQLAGQRVSQHLLAEADPQSEAYGYLRREGFAVYARQTIWQCTAPVARPAAIPKGRLRPFLQKDMPAILSLYASVVPAMVQQVETLFRPTEGYVLVEEGEVTGFFRLQTGPCGSWIEPFFHPSARHAADWFQALLSSIYCSIRQPLFVCVRTYQDGFSGILSDFGFRSISEQAVMVRRVVVPVPAAQPVQLQVAEHGATHATSVSPPSPYRKL